MDYSSILSKPKSFFGKQKVWMARGQDSALFNTHRPNIQNHLKHSCIPESSHNLWIGLYRIGITEDEAKTFVVVSCTDRRIRKLTRDILSSCPIFQPGQALDRFKVISKATLPETACEPQQTMQDEQEQEYEPGLREGNKGKNIAKAGYRTIRISPSITGDSYLCRQVQARQVSGKGEVRFQTATAGPLISLDGRAYQLTVAHVVNFEEKEIYNVTESATDDWDDWDDEGDDDTDSGCSVDEDVASWDISTRRDSTPDPSDDDIPSSLSSDSTSEIATRQHESGTAITKATSTNKKPIDKSVHPPFSPRSHLSQRPVLEEFLIDHASSSLGFAPAPENCQISTEMDYLLIPTNTDLQVGVSTSKSAELVQISEAFDLQGITEPRPVIIATASLGYMEGVIFPSSSLLRTPGSKDFQALYCIESDIAIAKGTSGSAVFDKRTGFLAGYIVLGCPEKRIWYMVPILDVLNELEVRFRQKGKCQIRLDGDADIRLSDLEYSLDTNWVTLCKMFEAIPNIIPSRKNQENQPQVPSKDTRPGIWGMINISMANATKAIRRGGPSSIADSPEVLLRLGDWRILFGHNPKSPEGDRQLFSRFKALECGLLEVMVFMLSCPKDAIGEHKITKTSRTRGTSFETIGESCNKEDAPQPKIRVEHLFSKGKALDGHEFIDWLKKKRLPDSHDTATYTPQCLKIWNIDPSRVVERRKIASSLPLRGFQELLSNLIGKDPIPMIDLTQDSWFGSTFQIVFNLPFMAIASHNAFGKTPFTRRAASRLSVSLSFLQQPHFCKSQADKVVSQPHRTCLYQTTWSTIVIGTSDRYWTAACLSDGFDEPATGSEYSNDAIVLSSNLGDQTGGTRRTMSPRAYSLGALAMQLEKIAEYHRHIQMTLDVNFKLFVRRSLV
ncbi:hypothetical protein F25303_14075 [Fusarium sp. NRRL 25303]|nr:hypothetical protein F25303_14075 [Fusarium sp. NRRL 25303]